MWPRCDVLDSKPGSFRAGASPQDCWVHTDLYDFTGGNDGAFPLKGPSLDTAGNIYGTAYYAGSNNAGVVWQITP